MYRKNTPITLQETGGKRFASLQDAQQAALPGIAADVAAILRTMLAREQLVNRGGRIVPTEEKPH